MHFTNFTNFILKNESILCIVIIGLYCKFRLAWLCLVFADQVTNLLSCYLSTTINTFIPLLNSFIKCLPTDEDYTSFVFSAKDYYLNIPNIYFLSDCN